MVCLGDTRRSTCVDKGTSGHIPRNKKCPTRIIVQHFSIGPDMCLVLAKRCHLDKQGVLGYFCTHVVVVYVEVKT